MRSFGFFINLLAILFSSFHAVSAGTAPPKYVILMICDGCGFNHVEASSLYMFGAERALSYQTFPVQMAMSTFPQGGSYNADRIWSDFNFAKYGVTDSAASATALATGVKTRNGAVSVTSGGSPLETFFDLAEDAGYATGVVSSVPFAHATPAAFGAHNKSRKNYARIAEEMLLESRLDVVMGAGHPSYNDSHIRAFTMDRNGDGVLDGYDYRYAGTEDVWKRIESGSLEGADADADGDRDVWFSALTTQDFDDVRAMEKPPVRVLGIAPVHATLQQGRSGNFKGTAFDVTLNQNVPTLAAMVQTAMHVLGANAGGYALMVEGGAVDWASHGNQSGRTIEEMIAFNEAVDAVIAWIEEHSSWEEALLIITADHETGHLTGPGPREFNSATGWPGIQGRGRGKMPHMVWNSGKHTNHLVPFYAKGVFSAGLSDLSGDRTDPVRGAYLDNADVGRFLKGLFAGARPSD